MKGFNPFYTPLASPPGGGFNFGPFGNLMHMISTFNQFRSTFQGDPQQKVQELLNSGKMTQDQFNQLSQMANQFRSFLH